MKMIGVSEVHAQDVGGPEQLHAMVAEHDRVEDSEIALGIAWSTMLRV